MIETNDDQRKKLAATVEIVASIFEEVPQTDFIVCAVRRDENGDVKAAAISNNLGWHDEKKNSRMQPPSIGMMTDLLVEAELFTRIEKLQKDSWRNKENARIGTPAREQ
jgi:hypothetical protein